MRGRLSAALLLTLIAGSPSYVASGRAGGFQPYPVNGPNPQDPKSQGDREYVFALSAINVLRSTCSGGLSPLNASMVNVYTDECFSQIVNGGLQNIVLNLNVMGSDVIMLISSARRIPAWGQTSPLFALHDIQYSNGSAFCTTPSSIPSPGLIKAAQKRALADGDSMGSNAKSTQSVSQNELRVVSSPKYSRTEIQKIPQTWDWRTRLTTNFTASAPALVSGMQQSCGSSYAFAAVTAISYRLNIISKGRYNVVPSPKTAAACTSGCQGGFVESVYQAMELGNIPADWSDPYTGRASSECTYNQTASIAYKTTGTRTGITSVLGEDAMMMEVWKNGPGAVYIVVNPSDATFQTYRTGVLRDLNCPKDISGKCTYHAEDNNHALTLVGWGSDGGYSYWLLQNSWGPGWGEGGYVRIERGKNAFGIESEGVIVGQVDTTNTGCGTSPICYNGGGYAGDCSCQCLNGFSGPTCQNCTKSCSSFLGNYRSTTPFSVPGSCSCLCTDGFTVPSNLKGYVDCGFRAHLFAVLPTTSTTSTPVPTTTPAPTNASNSTTSTTAATTSTTTAATTSTTTAATTTTTTAAVTNTTTPAPFNTSTTATSTTTTPPTTTPAPLPSYTYENPVIAPPGSNISFIFGAVVPPSDPTQVTKFGDFLIAVPSGLQPWTPEAGWVTNAFKVDVCGPRAWPPVPCNMSISNFSITDQGFFDVYYVKYLGLDAFGQDIGFGQDFWKLPQTVCTYANTSRCSDAFWTTRLTNANQLTQRNNSFVQRTSTVARFAVDRAQLAAAQQTANPLNESLAAKFSASLIGISLEYVGMKELLFLKKAIADNAGQVCAPSPPPPGPGAGPDAGAPPSSSSSLVLCTRHHVVLRRLQDIGDSGAPVGSGSFSVDAVLAVASPDLVDQAQQNLALAVFSGAFQTQLARLTNTFLSNITSASTYMACASCTVAGVPSTPPPPPSIGTFTLSHPSYLVKDLDSGTNIEVAFLLWKVQLTQPIYARPTCPPYDGLTLRQVYERCNPANPSNPSSCRVPITFTCGNKVVDSIVNLNSLTDWNSPAVMLAPPVDMPFVNILTNLPSVPTYDIAKVKDAVYRNDTLAFVVATGMSTNGKSMPNPFAVPNSYFDVSTCTGGQVTIGGSCDSCDYEFVDSLSPQAQPIAPIATQQPPTDIPCNLDDARLFSQQLNTTLDKIANANSKAEFDKGVNTLNIVINLDAFLGCAASVSRLTSIVQVPVDVDGGRACIIDDPESKEYLSDPCCNYQLQFSKCCAPSTLRVNSSQLDSIDYLQINKSVPVGISDTWAAPEFKYDNDSNISYWTNLTETGYLPGPERQNLLSMLENLLNMFVQSERVKQDAQFGCEAVLKSKIPPNYLYKSIKFLQVCANIIYSGLNKNGKKSAKCGSDADCYTTCDSSTKRCSPPTPANGVSAFVQCSLDKMTPKTLLYARDLLGVSSQPAADFSQRFSATLATQVTDSKCDGPEQFSVGACLLATATPSDCVTLQNTFSPTQQEDGSTRPPTFILDKGYPDNATNTYNDMLSFQYIFARTDIFDNMSCAVEGLDWVTLTVGKASRSFCRVPDYVSSHHDDAPPGGRRDLGVANASTASPRQCGGRRSMDACNGLPDMERTRCERAYYFTPLCGGVPDSENFFDPDTTYCTTLVNALQYAPANIKLDGVGNCKISNFGFTNGLLPLGFMTSDQYGGVSIDWHSPLHQYEDQNYNVVPISSNPSMSVAQTRCQQIQISLATFGFKAASSQWYQYDTMTKTEYNPDTDEYVDKPFAGNKTTCEMERKCNSDSPITTSPLSEAECTQNEHPSFCGIPLSNSTLIEISTFDKCFIPSGMDRTSCSTLGGNWNPRENYLQQCDAGPAYAGANCFKGCSNRTQHDDYTNTNIDSYGACEIYHVCTLNVNYALCTAAVNASGGWINKSADGYPQWMTYSFDTYSMTASTDPNDGRCVLAYQNPNSPDDAGGDRALSSSAAACAAVFVKMLIWSNTSDPIITTTTTPVGNFTTTTSAAANATNNTATSTSTTAAPTTSTTTTPVATTTTTTAALNVSNATTTTVTTTTTAAPIVYYLRAVNITGANMSGFGQWSPARSYRKPFMATQSDCAQGLCIDQLFDPTAKCGTNSGTCSLPCPSCRALGKDEPDQWNAGSVISGGSRTALCVDPAASMDVCTARSGWDYSNASGICYRTSTSLSNCSAPYVIFACDMFNQYPGGDRDCPGFSIVGQDSSVLLQCVYDLAAACPDQASCESRAACDDDYLSNPLMPPWAPPEPACVVPFSKADYYGFPDTSSCDSDGAWVLWEMGCVYWPSIYADRALTPSITVGGTSLDFGNTRDSISATCKQAGGRLTLRATSEDQCVGESFRCLVEETYYQNISQDQCSNENVCDPLFWSWQATRTWTSATWSSRDAIKTSWVSRAWAPVNSFVNTFSFTKMFGVVADAVGNEMSQAFSSYAQCSIGQYGPVFQKVAAILSPNSTDNNPPELSAVANTPLASLTCAVDLNASAPPPARRALRVDGEYKPTPRRGRPVSSPEAISSVRAYIIKNGRRAVKVNASAIPAYKPGATAAPRPAANRTVAVVKPPSDPVLSGAAGSITIPQSSLASAASNTASSGGKVKDTSSMTLASSPSAQFKNPSLEPQLKSRPGTRPSAQKRRAAGDISPGSIFNTSGNCLTGYAIVQNTEGVIVGQLVGSALGLSGQNLSGLPVNPCFNSDPGIIQCINETKFPVLDIAVVDTKQTVKAGAAPSFTILQVPVTINASTSTTQTYCARNVPAPPPGKVLYPIRRASNINPKAVVILTFTFTSISDPSKFSKAIQGVLKAAIVGALAKGGVTASTDDITITAVCKADGKGCTAPPTTRRQAGGGVTATTSVSTSSAKTVSTSATSSGFTSGFVTSWNTAANSAGVAQLRDSELTVASKGIVQPLAPPAPGSLAASQQALAAGGRAAAAAPPPAAATTAPRVATTTPKPTLSPAAAGASPAWTLIALLCAALVRHIAH